eukprot:1403931-Prymnesium_polylepis.2
MERPRVLVPGAGLGRLVYEAARLGCNATGVESSYFMLVPAQYVLNKLLHSGRSLTIRPFVHETANVATAASLCRTVEVPGEPAHHQRPRGTMRMAAEEWESFCADEAQAADAVLTCFFVDACPDVTRACEQIRSVLRPGGLWINQGPLLYHWNRAAADVPRLSADELLLLIGRMGFEVLEHDSRVCTYSQDPLSMCRSEYDCLFFVARRSEEERAAQ